MKLLSRFVLLLGVVLASLLMLTPLSAQEAGGPSPVGLRPDAPTYALHGPYWVGTKEFMIPAEDGIRRLPATIWYPALNPEGLTEANTYRTIYGARVIGHALASAAPMPPVGRTRCWFSHMLPPLRG